MPGLARWLNSKMHSSIWYKCQHWQIYQIAKHSAEMPGLANPLNSNHLGEMATLPNLLNSKPFTGNANISILGK